MLRSSTCGLNMLHPATWHKRCSRESNHYRANCRSVGHRSEARKEFSNSFKQMTQSGSKKAPPWCKRRQHRVVLKTQANSIRSKRENPHAYCETTMVVVCWTKYRGPRWLTSKPLFTLEKEEKLYYKPWSMPIEETDWNETTWQEQRRQRVRSSGGSRILDLTQIRAQTATMSRPKAPKITPDSSRLARALKEIKDASDSQRFNKSRNSKQGGKNIEGAAEGWGGGRWTRREVYGPITTQIGIGEARWNPKFELKKIRFEREFWGRVGRMRHCSSSSFLKVRFLFLQTKYRSFKTMYNRGVE